MPLVGPSHHVPEDAPSLDAAPLAAATRREASAPVAILAPAGRDGPVTAKVLMRAGLVPRVCEDIAALCEAVREEAGVLLVAEEALAGGGRERLLRALDLQPSWSDVPLVVLTGEGELSRTVSAALDAVTARGNVTLLERPVRVATLVTTIRSALRARGRQFDVRDHLRERSEAETALRAAQEEAETANRSKSEFLAMMSHELRTPLNAIGGYAELIQLGVHGPVTEEQRTALERIQRSQRHLLGLINGVLNYARIEAGAVHYDLADVALDDVLATCEALTAPQMGAKGLVFERGRCTAGLVVRTDREKLQQILLNLLSNAIKFTPAGGRVELRCDRAASGGGPSGGPSMVRVQVLDTGIGIAPEALARIFEPFVQVDTRFTRSNEGTGLGLAISRDLARGIGGELTAESRNGAGSTFTLTLPAAGAGAT